jgi:hypothetical protein
MAGRPSAVRRRVDRPDQLGEVGSPCRSRRGPPTLGVDMGEPRLRRQVVAVRVDVLAEQRHLAIAGQASAVPPRRCRRTAGCAPAAAERDDAVGAGLVAAVDDRQPGADRRPARDGPSPIARARVPTGCRPRRRPSDRPWSSSRRAPIAPWPRRARVDRRAPAPRPGAGRGRRPGTAGAARHVRPRGRHSRHHDAQPWVRPS